MSLGLGLGLESETLGCLSLDYIIGFHKRMKQTHCTFFSLNRLYLVPVGFEGTSTLPGVVYRGRTFPGLGFMLKKSFYTKEMQNNMAKCCMKRYCMHYDRKPNVM